MKPDRERVLDELTRWFHDYSNAHGCSPEFCAAEKREIKVIGFNEIRVAPMYSHPPSNFTGPPTPADNPVHLLKLRLFSGSAKNERERQLQLGEWHHI